MPGRTDTMNMPFKRRQISLGHSLGTDYQRSIRAIIPLYISIRHRNNRDFAPMFPGMNAWILDRIEGCGSFSIVLRRNILTFHPWISIIAHQYRQLMLMHHRSGIPTCSDPSTMETVEQGKEHAFGIADRQQLS